MTYRTLRRERVINWCAALAVWLALGYSVGWYRAATSLGDAGWPLPAPVAGTGFLAYTFGVNELDPPLMQVCWLVLFPCAGVLWVALQCLAAPYFEGRRVDFAYVLKSYAWSDLPIILAAPVVVFLLWRDRAGQLTTEQLIRFAQFHYDLRPWLGPLFVGLALVSLSIHILTHRKMFDLRGKEAWTHFLVSLALLIMTALGSAALLDGLIRFW